MVHLFNNAKKKGRGKKKGKRIRDFMIKASTVFLLLLFSLPSPTFWGAQRPH
jgi:hypothetical protein